MEYAGLDKGALFSPGDVYIKAADLDHRKLHNWCDSIFSIFGAGKYLSKTAVDSC